MTKTNEFSRAYEINPDDLPVDLGQFAFNITKALDTLALPRGEYRVVGSTALHLHGIRLDRHPLTEEMLLEKKRPGDLDILVTRRLFDKLAENGQTPGGIEVGGRYFGSGRSDNVLRTNSVDSPIELPIDYIYGHYYGSRGRYDKGVVNAPYALLGDHKVITLSGIIDELGGRRIDARTLRDRQAIRDQAGI